MVHETTTPQITSGLGAADSKPFPLEDCAQRKGEDDDQTWICLSKEDREFVPRMNKEFFDLTFPKMSIGEVEELTRRLEICPDQAQISTGFLSHASYPLHFLCESSAHASMSHLLLLRALVCAYPEAAQIPDGSSRRLFPAQLLCTHSDFASPHNIEMLKVLLQTYPEAALSNPHCSLDSLRTPSASSASSRASSSSNLNQGGSARSLQAESAGALDSELDGADECQRLMAVQLLRTRINLYTWGKMSPYGSLSGSSSPTWRRSSA